MAISSPLHATITLSHRYATVSSGSTGSGQMPGTTMLFSAFYAAVDNVFSLSLFVLPMFLTAVMMLDGRFVSKERRWVGLAFSAQFGLCAMMIIKYVIAPREFRYYDGLGILGMAAFQKFAMGTIAGVFIGSAFLVIDDWLKRTEPTGKPPRRLGIPWLRRKPPVDTEQHVRSNVIPMKRAS